jgi:hypothetical protein
MSRTNGRPVADHPLTCFGSGVLDVETIAGLVLAESPLGVAVAELLPGVAFPLVVGAMDLRELRGRHVVVEFSEQPAGTDRRELRLVTGENEFRVALAGDLDQLRETARVIPASSITTTVLRSSWSLSCSARPISESAVIVSRIPASVARRCAVAPAIAVPITR